MTTFNQSIKVEDTRNCKRCKGIGTCEQWIWNKETQQGHHGPGPCKECNATGKIGKPDFDKIFQMITKSVKGSDKRAFRTAKPKFENEHRNQEEGRAYFVWRMVRFHSGQDVTMPVVASMCVTYDPYDKELDGMADAVAKHAFGTNMAGAYRWANALGYNMPSSPNLPASAYSGGPVVMDNNKPPAEHPELF